jgi:hypothetical protein
MSSLRIETAAQLIMPGDTPRNNARSRLSRRQIDDIDREDSRILELGAGP